MYLSQLPNVFVQIAKRQNSNTISFVSHDHSQRQNYFCCLMFCPMIKCFITFLNSKDLTFSMCHFSFCTHVFPNVPKMMHVYTLTICLPFLICVFSNVSLNRLPERRQRHIGCICLAFLHYAF